jgi:uncharacterized RDD family membrane protein YckC
VTAVPASFVRRVGAHLVDVVLPAVALLVVVGGLVRTRHPLAASGILVLGSLALLVFVVWNSGFRQGGSGQSLGKRAAGIRLVGADGGRPIGFGRAVTRQIAHLLDTLPLGLGYLWPLWDESRQTFADKACGTVVVRVEG